MKSKTFYLVTPIIGAALLLIALFSLPGSAPGSGIESAQAAPEAFTFTTHQVTANTITDTHPAIAVDGNGKAHIAYEQDGDIHYLTNASGSWITTTIAADGYREFKPSIAVDSSGYVHIAHFAGDSSPYWLYYVENTNGGLWGGEQIQTVPVPHPWHLDGGIALDGAGRPYVVYAVYDGNDYEIEMRYHDGTRAHAPNGGWGTGIITDNSLSDERPSIAVQSDGKVHVVYQQYNTTNWSEDLYYATNASGSWVTTKAAGGDQHEQYPSIALDSGNKAHIAYEHQHQAMGYFDIAYATNASGTWITDTVHHDDDVLYNSPSIAIDSNNQPHIAYSAFSLPDSNARVTHATNASGVWEKVGLNSHADSLVITPMDQSIALDNNGYIHMTFAADGPDDEIYYAKSDQPAASSGTCAAPLPIICGQQVAGETTGKANNINSYSCSPWNESGPEEIYAFTLAAGHTYSVTAQLLGFSADLDIFLLGTGGCDAGQCLDANSYGDTSASATGIVPGTYYIAVDGYGGAAGSYTMRLTCETEGGGNQPPNIPSNPAPADNAIGVSLNPTLGWAGGDPDGDPIPYTVDLIDPSAVIYLWCQTTDTTSCADQNGNTPLQPNTKYSWQVTANDNHLRTTIGPVWDFTTVSGQTNYKIYLPLVRR